jgi:capsular polysaccharide transport system ATP-binding protein
LIGLVEVAKSYAAKGRGPTVLFRPTTITIPTDRRLAILGGKSEGKTVLLQLLAGAERPDTGRIVSWSRLSPVVNADPIFHRNLSGIENVRFYARRFGVGEEPLLMAMNRFYRIGPLLDQRVGDLPVRARRSMEAALAAAFAFDCYLVDDVGLLDGELVERLVAAAGQRRAGLIFAAGGLRQARLFADCAIVIRDRTLHPFNQVEEAARFYGRD